MRTKKTRPPFRDEIVMQANGLVPFNNRPGPLSGHSAHHIAIVVSRPLRGPPRHVCSSRVYGIYRNDD